MKLLGLLVFSIILMQAFSEALPAANSTATSLIKEEKQVGYENKILRPIINCDSACAMRCARSSRTNLCTRACSNCCMRCQCVPPGTHGNHHLCPCYASLRTHGNRPKCP